MADKRSQKQAVRASFTGKKQFLKYLNWHVLLRIVGLVLFFQLVNAPKRHPIYYGPPAQVITHNPKMGVHTRLTDEVEEWKIQRTLSMVREMGCPWIVEYFPWAYYEPRRGVYRWDHADTVVKHAQLQGLTVIARIDFVPEWARPADTTFRYLDANHFADYAAFVARFAAHFQGQVPYIVVWNEPNLAFEWGYRQPDPEAYTELLRQTYLAAKAANPEVQILAAGLAPTMAPAGSEWGMDDLLFLERMYQAGAGEYLDGMAIHAYGFTFPPDAPADPQEVNFSRAELIHQVMQRHGDGSKPCFITEGGWNDHPRWTKAVRPYERIVYTIRAYEKARTEWPWCRAVCLWVFRYPWPQRTFQDYFAFVTPDFIPKPIYAEVRHYARGEAYEYIGKLAP